MLISSELSVVCIVFKSTSQTLFCSFFVTVNKLLNPAKLFSAAFCIGDIQTE